MSTVALSTGVRLAVSDQGSGAPLVALHGFTGTARSHLGGVIDALSATHRVIAPDLRGYGRSRPPLRDFPPNFYDRDAADVAALIEALGCAPAVVLGFSDGAETALVLAAERPDLVRGVVAWGVCGVISAAMVASVQAWLPVEAWGERRADWREEIIRNHGAEQFPSMVTGWVAAAEAIHAAGGDIVLGRAHRIACPTLMINGAGEVGNTPADAAALAARIPACQLEIVPDAGHPVHVDQAARFLELVREFLGRLDR